LGDERIKMMFAMKAFCLALYLGVAASFAIDLPTAMVMPLRMLAAGFLVVHVLEAVIFIRHVRLYQGSLAVSLILTLLFGLLHWKPLVAANRR
jgi:hypothetical protein